MVTTACWGEFGRDTLNGGDGDDTLEGSVGFGSFSAFDTFVFEDNHGHDVILDFSQLTALTNMGDVTLASSQQGADVLIDTGSGNSILLENVLLGDLDAGDFTF